MSSAGACAPINGSPNPVVDYSVQIQPSLRYFSTDVLTKFASPSDADRDGLDQKTYRDLVISHRLTALDVKYTQFTGQLWTAAVSTGLGSDLIVLLLGGLATVLTGADTKAALAAGVTGVTGAKASFDKNAFYQKTLQAIITEMNANRLGVLVDIRKGQKSNASDYSLGDALSDLARYEMAGTVDTAIASITEKTQKNADAQAQNVQNVQRTAAQAREYGSADATKLRATLVDKINGLDDGRAIIAANKFLTAGQAPYSSGAAAKQALIIQVNFAKDLASIKAVSDALQ